MEIAIDRLKNTIKQNEEAVKMMEDRIKERNEIIMKAKIDLECIEKGMKIAGDVLKTFFEDDAPMILGKKIKLCDEESEESSKDEKKPYVPGYRYCKHCNNSIPARVVNCKYCLNNLYKQ